MRTLHVLATLGCVMTGGAAAAEAPARGLRATLVYETGPSYILQNDGEYGADGTRYGADDVGQQDNLVRTSRTSLELAHGRHALILLYAPVAVATEVELARDLQFRDEAFLAGTLVEHRYLFDGYRASYLYTLRGGPLTFEVGGSLQIRNAAVTFTATSLQQRATETDIGLVPALKARLWWRPRAAGVWAALEADGFSTFGLVSGVRGAIYDAQLMLGAPVGRGIEFVLGARLLGGGADVASRDLYNWANFLQVTAGARITLDELVGARRRTR